MGSDLTRYIGNTAGLKFTLKHPDTGAIFDPTGHVLIFTVKLDCALPDTSAVVQKISTVGGIAVENAEAGGIVVTLVPADWARFQADLRYYVDVLAQSIATGALYTVASAGLVPSQAVTRTPSLSIATVTTNPAVGISWDLIPDKPDSFVPAAHAASHATDGSDPIDPAAIGAETPAGAQAKVDAAIVTGMGGQATVSVGLASSSFVCVTSAGAVPADASALQPAHAFVRAAVTVGQVAPLYKTGALNGLSGLTRGTRYYLSGTLPGQITETPPASGLVQILGVATDTDTLLVEIGEPVLLAA